MKMILTSECEKCNFGVIDDSDKAVVKVKCAQKDKEYYYGQCIPCDNMRRKKLEVDKAGEQSSKV